MRGSANSSHGPSTSRRVFLRAVAGASAACVTSPRAATALGRTPFGGRIAFHVPWPVTSIDPHELGDPTAALFASAIADPIFAFDVSGAPYPTLAAGLPTRQNGETIVRLREGLRTARGHLLDARDLVASFERARARGGSVLLERFSKPKLHRGDALAAVFGDDPPSLVAEALASPILAILPRKFDPTSPDGTGPFRADIGSQLTLTRNLSAARGAAFLDGIDVAAAPDLKTSLRAFEAEQDDLGWLGLGLYGQRPSAERFSLGRVAWIVLVVASDAGPWSALGAAQQALDAIPTVRLAHLNLGPRTDAKGDPSWTGPPSPMLVDEASPHLLEIARTLASVMSTPGHEVTAMPLSRAEIARRKVQGKAPIALEVIRTIGPQPHHTLFALGMAEVPHRIQEVAAVVSARNRLVGPRDFVKRMRVAIVGDILIEGGVVPKVVIPRVQQGEGWDLGAAHLRPLR